MVLSFQTGFSLVNAAVICATAILEIVLGLEPSSDTTEPRYLKLRTVQSFCPFILISLSMRLVFFISLIFMLWAVEALSRHSTNFASPFSSSAKPSMSSAKRRLVIALPPLLTVHSRSSYAWSFPEIRWRGLVRVDIHSDTNCYLEPVSYAAIEEDCTGCLIIQTFGDSDRVGTNVEVVKNHWSRSWLGTSFHPTHQCSSEGRQSHSWWSVCGWQSSRVGLLMFPI